MRTKIFFLLATMLLTSMCAFAQSGNNGTLKGDVNGDGVVDVADINAIIQIMKDGGGTADENTWYLAETAMTEEELLSKDQSYFDGLRNNQATKPTNGSTIQFHAGYNVMIIPETWGVPVIADDSDFTMIFSANTANDLNEYSENNISNPSGKLLLTWFAGGDATVYIKWNE